VIYGCDNHTTAINKCSNTDHISKTVYELFTQDSAKSVELAIQKDLAVNSNTKQHSSDTYVNHNGDSLFVAHSNNIITVSRNKECDEFTISNNGLISGLKVISFDESHIYGEFFGCNGSTSHFMVYSSHENHLILFD
jgi:hypothetical protein